MTITVRAEFRVLPENTERFAHVAQALDALIRQMAEVAEMISAQLHGHLGPELEAATQMKVPHKTRPVKIPAGVRQPGRQRGHPALFTAELGLALQDMAQPQATIHSARELHSDASDGIVMGVEDLTVFGR